MKAKTTARPIYSITKLHGLYRELAHELHIEQVDLQITPAEMQHLQALVFEKGGIQQAATYVGLSSPSYLAICAGFIHLVRPRTIRKTRRYLDKWKTKSGHVHYRA